MKRTEIIAAAKTELAKFSNDAERAEALIAAYAEIEPRSIRGNKATRFYGQELGFGPGIARKMRAAGFGENVATGPGANSVIRFYPIEILQRIIH